ncbi:hypothetical protein MVEN_01163500 [Mycena venus]|uniref:Uncharacterized protein n=1 Tax=Mycena venus TaxID=2733690 RepID=A0A8H6Y2B9_9AGAR|nr:hypothetical protein MVEN_01163500 [Mycena venus]
MPPVPKRTGVIRTWTKLDDGAVEETALEKVPEPIVALQTGLSRVRDESYPQSSEDSGSLLIAGGAEAKAMVAAIENICGATREKRRLQGKGFVKGSRKKYSWW